MRRLPQWPISARIHLITGFALLGIVALTLVSITATTRMMEEERITLLRTVTESAVAIARAEEAEERAGRSTREDAQRRAAEAIRAIRYRGDEYIWINDMTPRIVMHPFRRDLEGRDVSGVKARPARPCSSPSSTRCGATALASSTISGRGPGPTRRRPSRSARCPSSRASPPGAG